MSYCRMGTDSDVYVIGTKDDKSRNVIQCFCSPNSAFFLTYSGIIVHLESHKAAGLAVPDYALEALREESARPDGDPEKWVSSD